MRSPWLGVTVPWLLLAEGRQALLDLPGDRHKFQFRFLAPIVEAQSVFKLRPPQQQGIPG